MEIMKPIASTTIPTGAEWVYEVKYDGFRCLLSWEKDQATLTSKNNKDLTSLFPEIVNFCNVHQKRVEHLLPVQLDGELTVLNHTYQANFSWMHTRGRIKTASTIHQAARKRPATLLAFDMLQVNGIDLMTKSFQQRKEQLKDFFIAGGWDFDISPLNRISYVPCLQDATELWNRIFTYKAEGIIAKRKNSDYTGGKNHRDWLKVKNWRTIQCVLTHYDPKNDYFTAVVWNGHDWQEVGKCKHGLGQEPKATLKQLFATKGEKVETGYLLPPAICAEIHTLDLLEQEIREPEFAKLLVNTLATDCTAEKLALDIAMLPEELDLTKPDKLLWPNANFTKGDLLVYLREISPYMLPFLQDHVLTLIRCPDGVDGESFFQKHLPDYAPSYIDSIMAENERLMICNNLKTLVWFGNHGALEYHIPFQRSKSATPSEIVFDLDPPDRERFSLAVFAAQLLKQIVDDLEIVPFVKTSGNKGLQVHIPIPENSMTYDETAIFTQAIARTLEQEYPQYFTTERMKKNRHERLYLDYMQHGRDKTIIAPYSPRKITEGTVATPLFWEELKEDLSPVEFTIANAVDRVKSLGDPFTGYFIVKERQNLDPVKQLIEE
ncbi:DNA ligase D [Lentibacillus sp. L22]|uniref:DNA ligase D n=1 Tax=Lentibacillus sp. L22 TaxID=3163028 RepID=UPI00346791C2